MSQLKAFLMMILLGFAGPAWAWSASGHSWVIKSAAAQLRPAELAHFEQLLKQGVLVPPRLYHSTLAKRLGSLGVWPDRVRDLSLTEVFNKYGAGKVPKLLAPWAAKTTQDWHYTNDVFVKAKAKQAGCEPKKSGALLQVFPVLLEAYAEEKNPKNRNVLLAFILHFIADAYQPLHLMSSVNPQCESDRGGNHICIVPNKKGEGCAQNLHQMWDAGFKVFEQPPAWHKKLHPTNIMSFKNAQALAAGSAAQVYKTNAQDYATEAYFQSAQKRVAEHAGFAVGHSVFTLRYLLYK